MNNNQHLSLTITHAAFGTEKYRPTGEETSLKQERLRVGIASAVRLDEKTIQMRFVVKAEQDEGFWCNEIGFWANNTLIAVYSSDEIKGEGLIFISDKVETTISFSLALEAMPVERIDVQIMQDQDKLIQLINQHENEDNPHPQYTPKTLTATSQNAVEETGHSHEIDKASTSQAGIVQLTNDTNSEAETLGLTAKAGKTLKGLIDALTRNLSNYIPNSKKSDAVTSPSSDTIATSFAAKTAYDKAVEADNHAESAYNLAESKQSPATTLAGYKIADFAQRALTASDNLNDITVKGIYHNSTYRNTPNNNYPEEQSGVLLVLSADEQIYFASNGKMFKRLKSNNNWANGWVRLDNLTTPIGADQNLDEITTDGNYYIVGSSKATLAKNYPVERGDGALEVFGNGYFQRFTTFHSCQVFNRRKVGGNWTNWVMSADDKSEIRQKTIDYTKAEGYAYSGFYRPNGDKLNNLPLASLMVHITHPSYTTNAHARGIGFSYGSYNGNQAWDIFTTAFDANGTYLGQKQIMTELGGIFRGDINLNNNMLGFSADTKDFINSKNIDGIWHDDNSNTFHFQSDSTYKKTGDAGNASLSAVNYFASGRVEIKSNTWGRIRAILPDGGYWQWEVNPASATDPRFNFVYRYPNQENPDRYVRFPTVQQGGETVAYQSWVNGKVAVLTGVVEHGATLPLPPSFSEGQCKFFVSMNFDDPRTQPWDIQESGRSKSYYQRCFVTGRTVTAQAWHGEGRGMDVGSWTNGRANYLVIGIK
ncbi:hypothetical protein EC523_12695 [Avibacterium paragallinarum]|nr:hypothetical protein EC523_12695 [Avibacterium paragallinarum]